MIRISRKILGTKSDLVLDGDRSVMWESGDCIDSWVYGDHSKKKSLDVLFDILSLSVKKLDYSSHVKSFDSLGLKIDIEDIPMRYVVGVEKYVEQLNGLVDELSSVYESAMKSQYVKTYEISRELLFSFERASIDKRRLDHYVDIEKNHTNISSLNSFLPENDGKCQEVVYSQTSTQTGRLIVKKGPRILTLPAKYRDIVCPSSEGKKIVCVDFVSLEPRVAAYLSGKTPGKDIYEDVLREIGTDITRTKCKLAVLTTLYGGTRSKVSEILGLGFSESLEISNKVTEYFGIAGIRAMLSRQIEMSGLFMNFFGRPIFFDESKDKNIVNHYIQSTAVDVAYEGFNQLISNMRLRNIEFSPLFLLHDALILEVKSESSGFDELLDLGVECELGHFPLSSSVWST